MKIERFPIFIKVLCVMLGVGLGAPCMTVQPKFGALSGTVSLLKPSMLKESSFSVIDGIIELLVSQQVSHIVIGILVLIFSVIFPAWKLWVLDSAVDAMSNGRLPGKAFRLVEKLGKFSMIDVFVMALVVLTVKGLPGGSEIHLEWGLVVFAAATVGSMAVAHALEREHRTREAKTRQAV